MGPLLAFAIVAVLLFPQLACVPAAAMWNTPPWIIFVSILGAAIVAFRPRSRRSG